MEDLMFIALCLMVPLGIIQVLSALVILIVTNNKVYRNHFAYYLAGVAIYFIFLIPVTNVGSESNEYLSFVYFFGGAWGLAIFHLSVFFRDIFKPKAYHHYHPGKNFT